MRQHKQHQSDSLQKSSVLFLQLGFVLALFCVYIVLEYESILKTPAEPPTVMIDPEVNIDTDFDFTLERKEEKQLQKKSKAPTKTTQIFTKATIEIPKAIDVLIPIDQDEPTIDQTINTLPGGDTLEPDPDTHLDFILIEDAPVFPGCEGLKKEASKTCFSQEISKFINKQFNTDIAQNLQLNGKQKIWVEFIVDKTGTVTDIQARASHIKLEKEAMRIVQELPQMIPGKQRTIPVNVRYTLPIIFQIY